MDPATYEHLRNKTLLFFIEKLLDPTHGNNNNAESLVYTNKRTLHDLSCQFGSKGFTKEMRQIAGGSQSGLKKFLQTYPSIFRIDGDIVSYNVNSSMLKPQAAHDADETDEGCSNAANANSPASSIDSEAVEYFRERLMQYGIGIWVPVKSLLGHRSQAPPHIRHVSGQHIREFTQFLSRSPEVFILNAQDEVLLKEFENYYNDKVDNGNKIDRKRIVELIEFYGGCLSERGPMLVEQLFCAGNLKWEEQLSGGDQDNVLDCFKTPNDLATFFKMYPQCFQVHSNLVTFSDSYKVGLEYLKRQTGIVVLPQATPLPLHHHHQQNSPQLQAPPKPSQTTASIITPIIKPKQEPTQAPKPSPSKSSSESKASTAPAVTPPQPKNLLKHRVSKILLQTINQNTEHDYKHDSVLSPTSIESNPYLLNNSGSGSGGGSANQFQSLCENGDSEDLRSYIHSRTTIVSNQRKAGQIIDEIIKAGEPVAVDFEGINLGNDGQITLVQVGTGRGSVFIFDVLTQVGLIEAGGRSMLGKLLTSSDVVKVMHDCRNDSVNLYRQFGIRLANVFDTQVAHIVVQMTGAGSSDKTSAFNNNDEDGGGGEQSGTGKNNSLKNISLNNLCSVYGTVCNPFKDKVKSVYRHDQKFWSRRPLTKQMIAYASCDVMCLVPSIYQTLNGRVSSDADKLKLFNELCEEQILTHIEPDEIRSRRRLRKNEADLRALREKLDKAFAADEAGEDGGKVVVVSNSSLVLSNREMRLLKHLNLTDDEKEKLKLSLKVAKKLEKMSSSSLPSRSQQSDGDSSYSLQQQQQQPQSSDSASNSELTSLEYGNANDSTAPSSLDPRIAQIDSLEAIINRLINDNNNGDNNSKGDEDAVASVVVGGGGGERLLVDVHTQTISTGDIVITKVFDD